MSFYKDSRNIFRLSIPLLSLRLVDVAVYFIGFVMVAKLGLNEFAAGSLAISVFTTLSMICVGILYAVGIKMSHAFGAKEYQKIRKYFFSGMLLAVLLSAFSVVFMVLVAFALPYLGQKLILIPHAKNFIFALCLPILPGLLTVIPNQLAAAVLKTQVIFVASLVNLVLSVGLLYVFIFGKFGFPQMGIWGFGVALFLADTVTLLIPLVYILAAPYFKKFNLTDFVHVGKDIMRYLVDIMKLGFPMGVQFGAEVSVYSVTTFLVGHFGTDALAAYQIMNQIVVIILMITFAFTEATAILVGQALGGKNFRAIRSYTYSSCKLLMALLLVVCAFFFLYPEFLVGIYINIHDPKLFGIVRLSVLLLYIAILGQLFDGIRNVLTGALRGLHDSRLPMYIGVFVMWCVNLPLGMALAFWLGFGPVGFAVSTTIAISIGSSVLFFYFRKKIKHTNFLYVGNEIGAGECM